MQVPRKVDSVLNFIDRFEELVTRWPRDVKWPMTQIAVETSTPLPHVVDYLSDVLDRTIDVHDPVSFKDIDRALMNLKQRMRPALEARHRQLQERRGLALDAYQKMRDKIRNLQTEQQWYGAYRTITYFAGRFEKQLPQDICIEICSESLRLGIKARVNFQELAQWLKRGVELCIAMPSRDATEDALDFIDAYGEYFIEAKQEKGERLIQALLCQLTQMAAEAGLAPKLKAIYAELEIPMPNYGFYRHEI